MAGKDVGIAIRADSTIEEGVGAQALAEQLSTGQLDHAPRPVASVIPRDGAARATLTDLATADAIFVLGDVTEEAGIVDLRIKDALKGVTPPELLPHGVPIADLRLKERAVRRRGILTVAAPYRVDLMRHAGSAIVYAPGQEAALFEMLKKAADESANALDGTRAANLGVATEAIEAAAVALKAAERGVLVLTGTALTRADAAEAAHAFARAAGVKVLIVGPMANSHGLDLIGIVPSHESYSYGGMLDGAKALILSHLDPAQDPDVAAALKEKELLVVHDSFLTDTAVIADVVLPAKTVYERDGTVVNLEGRFLSVNAAPVEAGTSEDFTGVVRYLGDALGVRLEGRSVRSARRVLRKSLDLDLAELPEYGVIPPNAATAKLKRANRGASAAAPRARPQAGGNMLITASMARSEYIQRNPHLRAALGGPRLRIHPDDGAAHGLSNGNDVRLRVAGMWRRATVQFTEAVPSGLMTLPSLPDQPQGLVQADLASLVVERAREGLAREGLARDEVGS